MLTMDHTEDTADGTVPAENPIDVAPDESAKQAPQGQTEGICQEQPSPNSEKRARSSSDTNNQNPSKKCKFDRRQWGNHGNESKSKDGTLDSASQSAGNKTERRGDGQDEDEKPSNGKAKRNVVVLVGYVGSGYSGLQK